MQSTDDPNNSMIISKRTSQRDTLKRKSFRPLRKDFRKTDCTENAQLAIAWTEEHCQYVDSLMAIDFSYTTTRNERQRHENNYILSRRQW